MSGNALDARIAKLRREIEKLSAKVAERLAQNASSMDGKQRELTVKRAQMLARRARQLEDMLDELQRGGTEPSIHTPSDARAAVR